MRPPCTGKSCTAGVKTFFGCSIGMLVRSRAAVALAQPPSRVPDGESNMFRQFCAHMRQLLAELVLADAAPPWLCDLDKQRQSDARAATPPQLLGERSCGRPPRAVRLLCASRFFSTDWGAPRRERARTIRLTRFSYRDRAGSSAWRTLNATGRPVVLELCRGPYIDEADGGYARDVAQIWRAARDHHDDFASTLKQVSALENATRFSGPHGWAYGDILMTGGQGCSTQSGLADPYTGTTADPSRPSHCPKQSEAEYRTEVTLYAILQSPLFLGTDPRNFTKLMADLLLNDDMLFVNQDYAAEPAVVTSSCGRKAYIRRLSDGSVAFAATNLESNATAVGICFDGTIGKALGADLGACLAFFSIGL